MTFRSFTFGACAGLLVSVVVVGCGPTVAPKSCSSASCSGCCTEQGDCLAGDSVFECGSGGASCLACAANEVCTEGACARFVDGDYDASFPEKRDASIDFDAGTYRPPDAGVVDAGTTDAGPANVSYATQIKPMLDSRCGSCHSNFSYDSMVNVSSRIIPRNLTASTIYTRTLSGDMPRSGSPLSTTQQNELRDWILNGAPRN